MDLAILGIGTAQPTYAIAQTQAMEFAATISRLPPENARVLETLYRRTAVQTRGSVLLDEGKGNWSQQTFYEPSASDDDRGPTTATRMARFAAEAPSLALAAAREAIGSDRFAISKIAHLVTASCTGFMAPGFDIALIQELPLSLDVSRTHVGFMGCHAAINALRVAAALAHGAPREQVLICATELCSLHFQYGQEPDRLVSNALFADGAAALVCGLASESFDGWRLVRTGSHLFPDSTDAMSWTIGNHGFEMSLSARVPELIAMQLRPWLKQWLCDAGFSLSQIGSWAIHPGGPRIVSAVSSALGLPAGADTLSREVLADCGNMSSPTILFIIKELMLRDAPRPCVALGFGPGLALEVALFR